jgi:Cytochrome c7 and related cytochrome c
MRPRRRRLARAGRALFAAALVLSSVGGFSLGRATRIADDSAFPHATHAKLFPTCVGCHAGIPSGDSAAMFPSQTSCIECHNGHDVKPVAWTYPSIRATNLRFDHARHARLSDSAGPHLDCQSCHAAGPSPQWMMVGRARPETCIACHAHPAPSHFAEGSPCATCHLPLTRAAALTDSAIAALPKPPSHQTPEFLAAHGAMATRSIATCTVCHARESCARCHVNAETQPVIASLAPDARVARVLRGVSAVYPVPDSHRHPDFMTAHGALARANSQSCATCHAQPSCRACHTGTLGARVIDALPKPGPGQAPGVQLRPPRPGPPPAWPPAAAGAAHFEFASLVVAAVDSPPPAARPDTAHGGVVRVHPMDFVRTHGSVAASGRMSCSGCHQASYCASCHQGNGQRRYHPNDFIARHASEAYARETQCASCHNTEVFCRSCHRDVGIGAASNRRSGAAHAGQPLWLLQHGEAARRGMQSCASCHQQTDCMQCHSTLAGRINPHGPDFDAKKMQKRNPSLCAYCHVGPPA